MQTVKIRFIKDYVKLDSRAGSAGQRAINVGAVREVNVATAKYFVHNRKVAEFVSSQDAALARVPVKPAAPIATASAQKPAPAATPHTANDPPPGSVEIPDNWRDLPWAARLSMASDVSPNPVKTKEEVSAAIEGELARRASKASDGSPTGETKPQQ